MKILHLYKDYTPVLGGIENHIRVLAEGQARRGHDVTVLAANRGWRTSIETVGGVRVVLVPRLGTIASTPICPSLLRWLSRLEADITHLHFPHPPGEVAHLLVGRAAGMVITYHADIVRQRHLLRLYEPLLKRVLGRANRILVTSPAYVESSRYLRAVRDKCVVVPIGIDVGRFEDRGGEPGSVAARAVEPPPRPPGRGLRRPAPILQGPGLPAPRPAARPGRPPAARRRRPAVGFDAGAGGGARASRTASSSRAMWTTAICRRATPRATCSCCRRTRGPRHSARRSWKPWRPACRSSARRFRRARRGSTRTASPASSSRRAIPARLPPRWPRSSRTRPAARRMGRAGRARASQMFEASTMVEAVEGVYREVLAQRS